MIRWTAVCCLAGAALLAGCHRHGAQSDASAPSIFARPHPKPGLWRTSASTNALPGLGMTGELCLDASNEDDAFSSSGRSLAKDCGPWKFQRVEAGFDLTIVCHLGRRTITTSGVATGDFISSYAADLTTRTDPPAPGLPAEMSSTIRAKWIGPCPPGQKPGQMSMKPGFVSQD